MLVLRGLIAAESVIPDLTQDKLLALTRWISSAPGFALTYPDLNHALAMIARLPLGMSERCRKPENSRQQRDIHH